MAQAALQPQNACVLLSFSDGTTAQYPYIWLRDNDPEGFHPDTQERITDLSAISPDITVADVELNDSQLLIHWEGADSATSRFDLDWLRSYVPGTRTADPARTGFQHWRCDLGAAGIPRATAQEILSSDLALRTWLEQTQIYGISIVEGLADSTEAGMDVARRIGFLRQTNFGVTFEVKSKPNPNNLAYTPIALPLHTDLTNQELPPGFQFLHCLANEARGGGSLFCDGYAIAEDLRLDDPESFELLSTVSVPFRFHDQDTDIRNRKKVITLDEDGRVIEICFNAHLADIFDLEPALMQRYYRAYRKFMILTRSTNYLVTLKLKGGEMVVFDNRRVLHGREAFDPQTGYRHLHGCYVDRGEFESRLRVLHRGQ